MSLLNDALRDLERRNALEQGDSQTPTGGALNGVNIRRGYGGVFAAVGVLILISGVVLLVQYGWPQNGWSAQAPALSEAMAEPASRPAKLQAASAAVVPAGDGVSDAVAGPQDLSAVIPVARAQPEETARVSTSVAIKQGSAAPAANTITAENTPPAAPSGPTRQATQYRAAAQTVEKQPDKKEPQALTAIANAAVAPVAPAAPVRQQPQSEAARDQRLAVKIERLLVEGREAEAERVMSAAVNAGQPLPRSHAAVAAYFLAQKRLDKARRWLPAPLVQADPALRLLQGRLLLIEEGVESALRFLEADRPSLAEAPDYHVTLASLYQQSGNAAAAGDRWGALLETDNRRADWWLGLALALDSQNQRNGARVAYTEALALPQLAPRLRDYAESRLRTLQ